MKDNGKKQILTLQSLRAFAIIMIFIEHTAPQNWINFFNGGGEGVSFFMVLSGFVTTLTCMDRTGKTEIINYMKKKLKKFYPLHIIMLFASLILTVCIILKNGGEIWEQLFLTIGKAVANAFLVQAFIPVDGWYMNQLNGVTWFLSATMFFYLIALPIIKKLQKIRNNRRNQIVLLVSLIVLQLFGVLCWKNSTMATYMLYVCPLFRSIDFISGMVMGILYLETKNKVTASHKKGLASVVEVGVLMIWLMNHIFIRTSENTTFYFINRATTFWGSLLLVFVFAYQKGFISDKLQNKTMVWLGNRSFEIYIVHKVVIQYVTTVIGWNNYAAAISAILVLFIAYFVHDVMPGKILVLVKSNE